MHVEKAVNGKINCMLSFGGGSLNNELESRQELLGREGCWNRGKNSSAEKAVHREILLHVGLGGGI